MTRRLAVVTAALLSLSACARSGPPPTAAPTGPPAITVREAPRRDAPRLRTREGHWTRGDGEWIWVSEPAEDGSVVVVAVPDAPAPATGDDARRDADASGEADASGHAAPAPDPRLPPPAERPGDLELRAGSRGEP